MKRFKSLNMLIKILISMSIMGALVFRMDEEKRNIISDLARHFHASSWFYSCLFMILQLVLLSVRWQYLLNIGQKHLTFMDALKINLTSQLANLVFVTSVGGILARIGLSVQHGASVFKSLIATVFDRLLTLSALIVLSALCLPNLSAYVDNKTFHTISSYISVFVIMMFVFAPLFLNFVVFKLPQTTRLKGRMRYGLRYLKILIRNPLLCTKLVLISIAAQLAFFVAVYILADYSGANITFWQMLIVLPMISLVAALPISIGGWGVREGAYVYGLGLLHVPMETAFLISIQVGLVSMLATILGGMPSLMSSNFSLSKMTSFKERLSKIRS